MKTNRIVIMLLGMISVIAIIIAIDSARTNYRLHRLATLIGRADGPSSILVSGRYDRQYIIYGVVVLCVIATVTMIVYNRKKK